MLQDLPAGPALTSVALSLPLPTAVFRTVLFCRHIVLYTAAAATAAASYQQDNTPSLQRCSEAQAAVGFWSHEDSVKMLMRLNQQQWCQKDDRPPTLIKLQLTVDVRNP